MKTLHVSIIIATSLLVTSEVLASSVANKQDSLLYFRSGIVNSVKTDGKETLNVFSQATGYEYQRFLTKDQSLILGFLSAVDPISRRDSYHTAYAGYRFYPLGIGVPSSSIIDTVQILVDSPFKFYIEGAVGLGHILFKSLVDGAGELASDTISTRLAMGWTEYFFKKFALDVGAAYEVVESRGGTSNALGVSATQVYGMMSLGYLF